MSQLVSRTPSQGLLSGIPIALPSTARLPAYANGTGGFALEEGLDGGSGEDLLEGGAGDGVLNAVP